MFLHLSAEMLSSKFIPFIAYRLFMCAMVINKYIYS